jgi:FAD/FMN-containing dehydrogenase
VIPACRYNFIFFSATLFLKQNAAPGTIPIPAVTVQTGVQFAQLYAEAEAAGRFVMGGTCDSVGVGGCWMGGCYGTLSRLYGAAASNLLEARVVLANGSLVVANAASEPDLFWAIRGGGAGLGGVVTEFTARTHAPPRFLLLCSVNVNSRDAESFEPMLEQASACACMIATLYTSAGQIPLRLQILVYSNVVLSEPIWSGYMGFSKYSASMSSKGFEANASSAQAMLQPLLAWVAAQVKTLA